MQHTANPEVSKIAQVGLLLAFSQIGNADKIETFWIAWTRMKSFHDGSSLNIGEIRKRLAQGRSTGLSWKSLRSVSFSLRSSIWLYLNLAHCPREVLRGLEFVKSQFADEGMLLSTRNLLAGTM